MKKIKKIALCLMIITSISTFTLDPIITFFLRKYPSIKIKKRIQDPNTIEKYSKKLQQPGYVSGIIIKSHQGQSMVPGVMCLYAGSVAISDQHGQVTFARRQQTPHIYILVTTAIKPAYMIAPTTIHNWMLDPKKSTKMYLIQLKQDQTSQLYYFETQETDLPKDHNIALNTIVIIAQPEYVVVPTGATITQYSPNLALPDMYIKKQKGEFCFVYNWLKTLELKEYFEQSTPAIKQEDQTITIIQQPRS